MSSCCRHETCAGFSMLKQQTLKHHGKYSRVELDCQMNELLELSLGKSRGVGIQHRRAGQGTRLHLFPFQFLQQGFPGLMGAAARSLWVLLMSWHFFFSVNIFLHWRLVFHRDLELKKCENLCSAHQDKGPQLPGVRGPRLLSQLDILASWS